MDDQNQGASEEVKPEVQEKLEEMKQESQTRAERSKTVDERLDKLTQAANEPESTPNSNQEAESQPKESEPEEKVALDNSKNPERTKEFIDKLKEENRLLKEKARKDAGTSVFDSLRQPQQSQAIDTSKFENLTSQQTNQIADNFIAEDGTVDINGLNKALKTANDRAQIAESEALKTREIVQQSEERQQVREAHTTYPELDPQNDKFDPNFYDLVALKLAKTGLKMTLAQAAAEVRKSYQSPAPVNLEKIKDEAVSQYKENLGRRNQGPLSTSKGEPRTVDSNPELRERTRQGDYFALDERLRKLGIIK
jgi:hypothetical protein